MKAVSTLLLFLATLTLAGCAGGYTVDGRSFATADEALAYYETKIDQKVAEIEPLPSPIGGPVVIVWPTQNHVQALARKEHGAADQEFNAFIADAYVVTGSGFARAIERRNIFEEVRITHAETPEGIDVPTNGYLVWYELRSRTTEFFHMLAAGERQTTEIEVETAGVTNELESWRRLLSGIEDFVKAHRPGA